MNRLQSVGLALGVISITFVALASTPATCPAERNFTLGNALVMLQLRKLQVDSNGKADACVYGNSTGMTASSPPTCPPNNDLVLQAGPDQCAPPPVKR
jgi:hypothetical protein